MKEILQRKQELSKALRHRRGQDQSLTDEYMNESTNSQLIQFGKPIVGLRKYNQTYGRLLVSSFEIKGINSKNQRLHITITSQGKSHQTSVVSDSVLDGWKRNVFEFPLVDIAGDVTVSIYGQKLVPGNSGDIKIFCIGRVIQPLSHLFNAGAYIGKNFISQNFNQREFVSDHWYNVYPTALEWFECPLPGTRAGMQRPLKPIGSIRFQVYLNLDNPVIDTYLSSKPTHAIGNLSSDVFDIKHLKRATFRLRQLVSTTPGVVLLIHDLRLWKSWVNSSLFLFYHHYFFLVAEIYEYPFVIATLTTCAAYLSRGQYKSNSVLVWRGGDHS
eukprot:CAMPEP_0204841014 /NCGR_PEP_ID=MMETSP1346-20131115/40117_1 /ASSEMBLY_ACC=CAM_ASM_000771 /TAXON_ID=215587 /ORGANISM="Aplanochytrium stocchinoi, Strain GSBS06" /LENGTH=328 /DNA_ID=CAMNT_0051978835 /DNA_START=222 /DNA_END=1204 /DNA_ORIENTATION=-